MDISDRMQCPPDFVAIPVTIALGSVIGRKVSIGPQRNTDWREVANLWGCIVGRPGAMKSPAMEDALKPLRRLEIKAFGENKLHAKDYEFDIEKYENRKKAAIKDGGDAPEKPEKPKARRYIVNDTSYEKLGVILADNPNGVLAYRDELLSLLKTLDREEQESARGFYLAAWSGKQGYVFDRITREDTYIEAACISLLGSTQPEKLAKYMRSGACDDGMIQRFSLLVWPDQSPEWREADRYAKSESKHNAWEAFDRLDALNPRDVGASADEYEPVPHIRFSDAARDTFLEWRKDLEHKLRGESDIPALEAHFAKYRKLVPSLALINHLVDGQCGPVGEEAVSRALAFAEYLKTHAERAYAAGNDLAAPAAKAILARIRGGDITDGFKARDIYRHHWKGLDKGQTMGGLELLCDFDWLRDERVMTDGRPVTTYAVNPRGMAK